MQPGTYVYVDFGEEGEPWHERLLLARVAQSQDYIILTPDNDVYLESLSCPPLNAIRVGGSNRALPIGLGVEHGQPVYRFTKTVTGDEFAALKMEAEGLAALAIATDPARYPGGRAGPELPLQGGPPGALPGPVAPAGEPVWLVMVGGGKFREAELISSAMLASELEVHLFSNWAIVSAPGGEAAVLMKVDQDKAEFEINRMRGAWSGTTPRDGAAAAQTALAAGPAEDARTLSVLRQSNGERFRSLQSVAEHCAEMAFDDWPLEGPRTAHWLVREMAKTGLNPIARHTHWRHENGIKDDEKMGPTHGMLSEILELCACIYQCDVSNLACMESVARNIQYIEFEVKKKVEAKRPFDSSEYYLGRSKKTGGALQSPVLARWVAERASRDSAIMKEQRKAAEERSLSRNTK